MTNIKKIWDNLDKKAQIWATRLTAVATIVGVLAAAGSWIIGQVDDSLATRLENQTASIQQEIKDLKKEADANNKQTELQLTRLELMTLIEADPENIIEIEKVAKRYFHDLGGNAYMSSEYTRWCKQYQADCEIIFK